jgi:hypothetical protein
VGRSRHDLKPEVRVPSGKHLFKGTAEDLDSQRQRRLICEPVPAHPLLLDHLSCDNFVDRGLDRMRRNRLIGSIARSVIWQGVRFAFRYCGGSRSAWTI